MDSYKPARSLTVHVFISHTEMLSSLRWQNHIWQGVNLLPTPLDVRNASKTTLISQLPKMQLTSAPISYSVRVPMSPKPPARPVEPRRGWRWPRRACGAARSRTALPAPGAFPQGPSTRRQQHSRGMNFSQGQHKNAPWVTPQELR